MVYCYFEEITSLTIGITFQHVCSFMIPQALEISFLQGL